MPFPSTYLVDKQLLVDSVKVKCERRDAGLNIYHLNVEYVPALKKLEGSMYRVVAVRYVAFGASTTSTTLVCMGNSGHFEEGTEILTEFSKVAAALSEMAVVARGAPGQVKMGRIAVPSPVWLNIVATNGPIFPKIGFGFIDAAKPSGEAMFQVTYECEIMRCTPELKYNGKSVV